MAKGDGEFDPGNWSGGVPCGASCLKGSLEPLLSCSEKSDDEVGDEHGVGNTQSWVFQKASCFCTGSIKWESFPARHELFECLSAMCKLDEDNPPGMIQCSFPPFSVGPGLRGQTWTRSTGELTA